MKFTLKLSLLVVALLGTMSVMHAQKFGYLNSAEIMATMPAVKQADANLEALQKQLQKKGQSMVEALQADYGKVQAKVESGELSPQQQQTEASRLEAKQAEIVKFEQDMVETLQNKRNDLLKPIYDKINQAIQDVAKENGYQFIFDQGVLLYAEDAADVSKLVKAKLGM